MTKREKYEALIASVSDAKLRQAIDADAQDNAFPSTGGEFDGDHDNWRVAYDTAQAMIDDPRAYGLDGLR